MKLRDLLSTIRRIQEDINASKVYLCGGAARDRYMDRLDKLEDVDLTTGDKTIDLISIKLFDQLKQKFSVTRKTMPDGHSSIFFGNLKIDFSSNHNTPEITNILKSMNINPTNIKKETFSRDFTCNALLMDFNLTTIFDPTEKGFTDIKQKIVRTCLPVEYTFYDTNARKRITRAIYIACKLGFDVDQSIIDYVSNQNNPLQDVSPLYITEKLNKAFLLDPERANYLVTAMKLWEHIPINDTNYNFYLKYLRGLNV
jgi:tRNA nucleotidyltransferase/poly(A) polymerase